MRHHADTGPRAKPRRRASLRVVELVLWGLAALCLGSVATIQANAFIFQQTAPPFDVEGGGGGPLGLDAAVPAGTPIARLVIPRLDVDVVVAEGTSERTLRRAAGRVGGSARPGTRGNIVIAGHRDTFFRPLEQIREGDLILLESDAGRRAYRVEWTRVVEPGNVGVLASGRSGALTLVTCYPFRYVGSAPMRFVVRAREHES